MFTVHESTTGVLEYSLYCIFDFTVEMNRKPSFSINYITSTSRDTKKVEKVVGKKLYFGMISYRDYTGKYIINTMLSTEWVIVIYIFRDEKTLCFLTITFWSMYITCFSCALLLIISKTICRENSLRYPEDFYENYSIKLKSSMT